MTILVDALQELPAQEDAEVALGCCWNTAHTLCGVLSFTITTCHGCTNTNG